MINKISVFLILSVLLFSCWKNIDNDPNIDINTTNNNKKTFVWFVATWCPHCKDEIPILDDFYRKYKWQVNMQMINTDWKKFIWNYIIPQDISNPISYEQITWEKCDYVPSFVIYDENKNITDKICGWKITFKELSDKLLNLNNNENMDNKDRIVKSWDKVAVHYVWKLATNGEEFDNSYNRWQPIEFEVWAKTMISWFENWVIWMKIGDKKTINLKSSEAYWEYSLDNIKEINKSELKNFEDAWYNLEVWVKLPTMYWEFEIKEVTDTTIKIDMNHPLAWKDLIFDIEMVEFKN